MGGYMAGVKATHKSVRPARRKHAKGHYVSKGVTWRFGGALPEGDKAKRWKADGDR